MPIRVRLNHNGFFTNFNAAVDWLAFGDAHGIAVGVDWRCDTNREGWDFHYGKAGGDRWAAYFAPLPDVAEDALAVDGFRTPELSGFRAYRFYRAIAAGRAQAALLRLNAAVRRHVRLQPHLAARIAAFARAFEGYAMIGVHLRNPAGSRGCYSAIPQIGAFIRETDAAIAALPSGSDWRIFAASDRTGLIEAFAAHYPGRVLHQEGVLRAAPDATAEIHATPTPDHDQGADVVSDCWLLARCAHLVGAQSAVALAACILNPEIRFRCARPVWGRLLSPTEYALKAAWCAAFEPPPPYVAAARRLIGERGE